MTTVWDDRQEPPADKVAVGDLWRRGDQVWVRTETGWVRDDAQRPQPLTTDSRQRGREHVDEIRRRQLRGER